LPEKPAYCIDRDQVSPASGSFRTRAKTPDFGSTPKLETL
jgi:hypothetical protein